MCMANAPHINSSQSTHKTILRDYQVRSIKAVHKAWQNGASSVCLVAPTGAGKSVLGSQLASGFGKVLWIAHRRELIAQAAESLSDFGSVGVIAPGVEPNPDARFQVATVQTLLSRGVSELFELIVADEFHHYISAVWSSVLDKCGTPKVR